MPFPRARRVPWVLCLTLLAAPGGAAAWTPPQGCRLDLTVQQRSCTVAQHYRCDTDAPGDQRVAYFTREGLVYHSRIDAETRWLESTSVLSGITDRLEPEARDHASLRTLLASGTDAFDFWTVADDGERLRHVGEDRLTGATRTIDGVVLDVTTFRLRTYAETGDLLIERSGGQYVDRARGRFHGGVETARDWTGEVETTDDTPVLFVGPGQPGFGEITPQYDCDVQMVGGPGLDGSPPGLSAQAPGSHPVPAAPVTAGGKRLARADDVTTLPLRDSE